MLASGLCEVMRNRPRFKLRSILPAPQGKLTVFAVVIEDGGDCFTVCCNNRVLVRKLGKLISLPAPSQLNPKCNSSTVSHNSLYLLLFFRLEMQ